MAWSYTQQCSSTSWIAELIRPYIVVPVGDTVLLAGPKHGGTVCKTSAQTKSVVVCLGHNVACPLSLYIELVQVKKEPVNIQSDVHLVHTHKEGTCHPTEHMSNQCFGTMTYDLCTLASVPAHSMQTTLGQESSPSLCLSDVTTHTSLVLPKSWSKPLDDDQLPFLVVPSQQLINSEYSHHIKWFHWLVLLLILLTRHSQERTSSCVRRWGLSTRPGLHLRTAIREQPNLPHADELPRSKGERGDNGLQPASRTRPYM